MHAGIRAPHAESDFKSSRRERQVSYTRALTYFEAGVSNWSGTVVLLRHDYKFWLESASGEPLKRYGNVMRMLTHARYGTVQTILT